MNTEATDRERLIAAGLSAYRETRGTLYYLVGLNEHQQDGWFMLTQDGRSISCRKIGGRNRWGIAGVTDALLFRRHDG